MRLPLVVHAPARRLLLAFIAAGGLADDAVGQAPPTLSDTISLTSGDVWSEKSTPSVLGTPAGDPVLDRSTLVPIAEESSTLLDGVGDATCNSCNGGAGGGVGGFYNRCGCDAPLFPNLTGPGELVGDAIGMPPLTGPYLFTIVGQLLAIVLYVTALRPDPLLLPSPVALVRWSRTWR